jgi:hypothetical protein
MRKPDSELKWYRRKNKKYVHRVAVNARPGVIVHHIDGDRTNNDPSNLVKMTRAAHLREHKKELLQARWPGRKITWA